MLWQNNMKKFIQSISLCLMLALAASCGKGSKNLYFYSDDEPDQLSIPLGLPEIDWPEDNPYERKKADLGKLLYFDKRLSSNGTVSCATCHTIEDAFTDNLPLSIGINEQMGIRNTPTVINSAYLSKLFWDGRASSLEEQCEGPISNSREMTIYKNPHEAHLHCQKQVKSIEGYRKLFYEVFGNEDCSVEQIAKAISTYERTVLSGNSPFDRYMAGDKTALTPQQIRGYEVLKKSGCDNCHGGPLFSDERFLNIGVGMDAANPDLGRYIITGEERDWGAFKIPTLRETEKTFPYMHDGSLNTLMEVIEYYDKGGIPNKNLNRLMKPLGLTKQEKDDLASFLKSLNGEGWQHFKEPTSFPQ